MQPQGSTQEVGTWGGREVSWEMDFELKAQDLLLGESKGREADTIKLWA